ncbi:putative ubiquitin-protein ligase [Dioszegia hungarica]|uniref:Anaphase-promoting complex subunit 11 n=1 Tax=Dioszegia hungarica TaxID=4972 RepID=A0AA38LT12_9TREE|nr:putative ubiquitin-protein ligase [Dioszegia hungarica]KAI9634260.1 putative ubiquitin-protein ligase [Dioszegia hungarica]
MKVTVLSFNAVAAWKWNASTEPHQLYAYASRGPDGQIEEYDDDDEEVCGICQSAFESTCPECKVPGDDCPLIWGECSHIFHMHCLLKWLETESSKQQCPMDRRSWGECSSQQME